MREHLVRRGHVPAAPEADCILPASDYTLILSLPLSVSEGLESEYRLIWMQRYIYMYFSL